MRPEFYNNTGMVNANGLEWHRLRTQLTAPLTNRQTPKHYAASMNQIADDFLALVLRKREEGTDVVEGFKELVYLAGLETVSEVALERRLGFLDDTMTEDATLILESIRGYQTSCNETMYGIPWWKFLPQRHSWCLTNLIRHKDNLSRLIGGKVDESLRAIQKGESFGEENSILNQLIRNKKNDLKDIKASVIDYITAGVETIGNSVIFTMALITNHPEVQRKLQAELDEKLSSDSHVIDLDEVARLPYLRACVQESFRLYPTACQIARVIETDLEVKGGYVLPKNSVVLCQQRIASLQEENFTRARDFIPERWLDSKTYPVCERALVAPFGVGKRACPGKRLAEQEMYVLVARLFQRYDVALVDEFESEFNFLLAPKNMRFKVTERKEQK